MSLLRRKVSGQAEDGRLKSNAMRWQSTQSGRTLQRLSAVALVLWLAGVGCFFGCEFRVSAAAAVVEPGAVEEGETCAALTGGHDCCAEKRQTQKRGEQFSLKTPLPPARGQSACCAFVPQPSDPARKIKLDETPATPAPVAVLPALSVKKSSAENHLTLRVLDRGSTYLRCCVFLI